MKLRKFWTQHRGLICFSGSPLDWLEVHSGNILVKGLAVILMKVKTSKHGTDWSWGQSDFQNFKARWTRSEPLNQFTWLWLFLDWVVLRPSSLWVTCSEVWREQKRNKHWRRRPRNRPSAAVSSERDAQKEFEDSFFEPLGPKYGGMKLSLSIFRLVFVTSVSYCCVFCFSRGAAWSGGGGGGGSWGRRSKYISVCYIGFYVACAREQRTLFARHVRGWRREGEVWGRDRESLRAWVWVHRPPKRQTDFGEQDTHPRCHRSKSLAYTGGEQKDRRAGQKMRLIFWCVRESVGPRPRPSRAAGTPPRGRRGLVEMRCGCHILWEGRRRRDRDMGGADAASMSKNVCGKSAWTERERERERWGDRALLSICLT